MRVFGQHISRTLANARARKNGWDFRRLCGARYRRPPFDVRFSVHFFFYSQKYNARCSLIRKLYFNNNVARSQFINNLFCNYAQTHFSSLIWQMVAFCVGEGKVLHATNTDHANSH